MPLYAYECQDCGEQSEVIQKFSDKPLTKCESCGGKLRKLLSAPSFHLKGGGWYADGYGSGKPSASDSGGGSESKSSESKSSESKTSESKDSGTSDTKKKSDKKAGKKKKSAKKAS